MDVRIEGQKWFYLALGMAAFINLALLLGRVSYSGYTKLLVLLGVFFAGCFILYQKQVLATFYILLILALSPLISRLIPYIRLGGFDVSEYDIISGGVFVYYIYLLLYTKKRFEGIQQKANKFFFLIMVIGLIPVLIEIARGSTDILHLYRFFLYFVWVPVLIMLVQEHHEPIRIVNYMVVINLSLMTIALIKHFTNFGFRLMYLEICQEINLFVLLMLFPFCIFQKSLLGGTRTTFIIFLVCLAGLLIDHSRKMYLGFFVGCILCYFIFKGISLKRKTKLICASLIIVLLVLGFCHYFGLLESIIYRTKSIFVLPSMSKIYSVDQSIRTRLYAWEEAKRIIFEHPLVGSGNAVAIDISNMLEAGREHYSLTYRGGSMHSFHISVLATYGVVITGIIYCIVISLLKNAWENIKSVSVNSGKYQFVAVGMFAGFLGHVIAMFFEGFEVGSIVTTWFLFGLFLGFANLVSKEKNRETR